MSTVSTGQTCPVRHPGQPDVEQQQIGEQRNRPVLAGREQRRRGEAAEQAEHRDEQRLAADRQQHRERGDDREQRERRPAPGSGSRARARRRTSRTGWRSPRRRARWRSPGSCRAAFSSHTTSSAMATATPISDADRRLQPALLDRVAQEEHRRDDERDAGDRREQLDADQALPVERRRRRSGGRGGGGGGTRGGVARRCRDAGRRMRPAQPPAAVTQARRRAAALTDAAGRRQRRRDGRRNRRGRSRRLARAAPGAVRCGTATGVVPDGAGHGGGWRPVALTGRGAGASAARRRGRRLPAGAAAGRVAQLRHLRRRGGRARPSALPASARAASAACGSGRAPPTAPAAGRTERPAGPGQQHEFQQVLPGISASDAMLASPGFGGDRRRSRYEKPCRGAGTCART